MLLRILLDPQSHCQKSSRPGESSPESESGLSVSWRHGQVQLGVDDGTLRVTGTNTEDPDTVEQLT